MDWTLPSTNDQYGNYLAYLKNRDVDLALGLDPATTSPTNVPTNAIRWNSANKFWEKYNGVTWAALTSQYAIDVTSLGGHLAAEYALLVSPAFTGTPTAPTPAAGDNSTKIATTAYVMAALAQLDAITGNVTLTVADVRRYKNITAAAAVTLPLASALAVGDAITFKSSTTQATTLERQSTDTIDGATQYRIPSYATVTAMKSAAGTFILTMKPDNDVGDVKAHAGSTTPIGWEWCDNLLPNRTTFGNLFAVVGTTFGVGDGSTTFGKPDLRGRSILGRDDMGGTAANRITNAGSGIVGTTLGASGGSETVALVAANHAAHNHGVNDAGHNHTHSDPTHGHGYSDPTHAHSFSDYYQSTGITGTAAATTGKGVTVTVVTAIGESGLTTGNGTAAAGIGITIAAASTGVTNNSTTTGITTQNQGSGTAHQNTHPALVLNYIIKS